MGTMHEGALWENPIDGKSYMFRGDPANGRDNGSARCKACSLEPGKSHGTSPTGCYKAPCGGGYFVPAPEVPAVPKSPRKAPKLQETSLQAHRSQKDKAPTDCMTVYNRLRKYPRGATCDQLEQVLNMSHQTTSARLNDLAGRGKVVDSGRREKTRTGRPAICWKVVP